MLKFTIIAIGGVLVVSVGLIFGLPVLQTTKTASGQIAVSPAEYDFGTASMSAPVVKYTYAVSNIGKDELKIKAIWTSCMCTTARLKIRDKESPAFGMHENPVWSEKLAPGQSASLEVTFDQALHGEAGLGDIVRAVYITSSDMQNPKVQALLIGKVVK